MEINLNDITIYTSTNRAIIYLFKFNNKTLENGVTYVQVQQEKHQLFLLSTFWCFYC